MRPVGVRRVEIVRTRWAAGITALEMTLDEPLRLRPIGARVVLNLGSNLNLGVWECQMVSVDGRSHLALTNGVWG